MSVFYVELMGFEILTQEIEYFQHWICGNTYCMPLDIKLYPYIPFIIVAVDRYEGSTKRSSGPKEFSSLIVCVARFKKKMARK